MGSTAQTMKTQNLLHIFTLLWFYYTPLKMQVSFLNINIIATDLFQDIGSS